LQFSRRNAFGQSVAHIRYAAHSEEVNVTRDILGFDSNDGITEKRGSEHSSRTPTDLDFAEFFGGGSECFPFRQSSLGLFTSIRLLAQEGD
jgi:hypothetical protein